MNDFLQENKRISVLILIILFLLLALFYFFFILPKKDEIGTKEQNIQQLKTEIRTMEAKLGELEEGGGENTNRLERKIPLSRSLDELLLHLEEVEMVSGSRIEGIYFTDYDGEMMDLEAFNKEETEAGNVETDEEEIQNTDVEPEDGDAKTDQGQKTEIEVTETELAGALPENVRYITLVLSVQAPDFKHFKTFLKEVEKLERITNVDTLTFAQPVEPVQSGRKTDNTILTSEIQLTTFYFDPEYEPLPEEVE